LLTFFSLVCLLDYAGSPSVFERKLNMLYHVVSCLFQHCCDFVNFASVYK